MTNVRSTVLRLERRIQAEHQDALVAIEQAYGSLAEALLLAAHAKGYLGNEPLAALGHLQRPRLEDHQVSKGVRELWIIFFDSFRVDEQAFEAQSFLDRAGILNERIQELPEDEDLPSALSCELLQTLTEFWPERQNALSERIDLLITNLNSEQQERGSSDLQKAHTSDELLNTRTIVEATLAALGMPSDRNDGQPLHKHLESLLKHYRGILAQLRDQMKVDRQRSQDLQTGLHSAAAGTWTKENAASLKKDEIRIVEAVAGLLRDNHQLEDDHVMMREDSAQLHAERLHLERGIQERDKQIAHYEFAVEDAHEDERLLLYRQIISAHEDDKDASSLIEKVRELERVFILEPSRQASLHKVLDRQLESLAQELADFRKVIPLTEDPKRYRPRLLGSSPYKLKTLPGVVQALRDAARDLLLYVEKARWSHGLKLLSREFKSLRRVFKEMVRLIADLRAKNGDAPPISSTISIDINSGIAALPAVLSKDIDSILRSKGASKYATELQGILGDVVLAYHGSLEKATGALIDRPIQPRRESALSAMRRLNDELLQLSSEMEQHFADAAATAYELPPEESELQERLVELTLSVRNVDSACEILADLDTAPKAEFSKLPSGKGKDAERLRKALKQRVRWLEEVARYRIEAPLV